MAFRRDLLRGSLELMVLSVLADAERYGYQILCALRERSDGKVDLRAGTVYPILHKLEREGCVRSRWDDSAGRDRKWYALTEKGAGRLHSEVAEWLDYTSCVRLILGRLVPGRTAPDAG